ncbi:hypothetical protein LTR85_000950 [Meristemomyces frigidus]|nr:hypothetical protein LTR85_000950 [Meristemomyces frigidus]
MAPTQTTHHCAWPAVDLYEDDDVAPTEAPAQPMKHSSTPHELSAALLSQKESRIWGEPMPSNPQQAVASPVPAVPTHAFPHDTPQSTDHELSAALLSEQESAIWGKLLLLPSNHQQAIAMPVAPAVPTHAFPHDTPLSTEHEPIVSPATAAQSHAFPHDTTLSTEHEPTVSPATAAQTHAFPHDTETSSQIEHGTVFNDMYAPNTSRRRLSREDPATWGSASADRR